MVSLGSDEVVYLALRENQSSLSLKRFPENEIRKVCGLTPRRKKILASACWQGRYETILWQRNPCSLQCGRKFALNHAISEDPSDSENLS
ncbi:hypothetical protein N7467_005994 [Penicillium canescens]|nr:hypothetical protein N7467_005994 [Penicillium canescens]